MNFPIKKTEDMFIKYLFRLDNNNPTIKEGQSKP